MVNIGIENRIRANLIRLRTKSKMGQKGLASRSGVTHVAQIESGARAAGKNVILKLALALGVDYCEFFRPLDDIELSRDRSAVSILTELYDSCSPTGKRLIEEVALAVAKYETHQSGRGSK